MLSSWGAYVVATGVLVAAMSPVFVGVLSSSVIGSGFRYLDGVRSVLDSLRPGMTVSFSYGYKGFPGEIRLEGWGLTFQSGGANVSFPSHWFLPDIALVPGTSYSAHLTGASVEVDGSG
ncbi:MAG: hypothetical protein HY297_06260 [Thaumarchaeota archaeon]|nr:hypothetical protein [Nitrososphaerota archaeon]